VHINVTFSPHTETCTKLSNLPPFGKSDHNYILLIPAYKRKLKQEAPVTWSIKWSEEADAKLPDCFSSTDWNIYCDSSDGIEEYNTSVTSISALRKSSPQSLYVHTSTRTHGLQAIFTLS
jgi:hypothetical protein